MSTIWYMCNLLQKNVLETVVDDKATASYSHNIQFPQGLKE